MTTIGEEIAKFEQAYRHANEQERKELSNIVELERIRWENTYRTVSLELYKCYKMSNYINNHRREG